MFRRNTRAQYRWVRIPEVVEPPLGTFKSTTALGAAPTAAVSSVAPFDTEPSGGPLPSLRDALAIPGLPLSNLSPEDEVVDLLMNAAEIEQGLLLQYLYAAYSATDLTISGIVKEIAIEEMGHLMTVQNMLLACGQLPYFARDDWAIPTHFRPFSFALEPAGRESLAKYAAAEMPDPDGPNISAAQRAVLPAILADAKASAQDHVEPHRVGLLYMAIYWLLRGSDAALADSSKEPWVGYPVDDVARMPGFAGRHVKDGFLQDLTAREGLASNWRGTHVNMIVAAIRPRYRRAAARAGSAGFRTRRNAVV
jgi:Ferritin-like